MALEQWRVSRMFRLKTSIPTWAPFLGEMKFFRLCKSPTPSFYPTHINQHTSQNLPPYKYPYWKEGKPFWIDSFKPLACPSQSSFGPLFHHVRPGRQTRHGPGHVRQVLRSQGTSCSFQGGAPQERCGGRNLQLRLKGRSRGDLWDGKGADLGGSSKYSNENFEGWSGEGFHVNSNWTWVSRS